MTGNRRRYALYLADLSRRRNLSNGIINYAIGLAAALPDRLHDDEQVVLLANADMISELGATVHHPRIEIVELPTPGGRLERLRLDHVGVLDAVRRSAAHTVHFPKGNLPLAVSRMRTPTVVTLHDDIPWQYVRRRLRGGMPYAQAVYFAGMNLLSWNRADRVLLVSDFAASQLAAMPMARQRHTDDAIVAGEGISLPEYPVVPVDERARQVLHLGSPLGHKQSARAIRWTGEHLRKRGDGLRLRVIGPLSPEGEEAAEAVAADRVRTFVPAEDLAKELAMSRALVFSSDYEAFGLPPVEAFASGTPAVFPTVTAMSEVMAGLPGGHDPGDRSGFDRSLDAVLTLGDAELVNLQRTIRERYDWAHCAEATVEVYRSLGRCSRT